MFTDNLADVHIINRQSTKSPALLNLLRAIYLVCAEFNIDIRAQHVAGEDNAVADYLSRPLLHKHNTHVSLHLHGIHLTSPLLTTQFIHSSFLHLEGTPSVSFGD